MAWSFDGLPPPACRLADLEDISLAVGMGDALRIVGYHFVHRDRTVGKCNSAQYDAKGIV
jgi:hypothetical protein